MKLLTAAAILLMVWAFAWMYYVGRRGPRVLNALAEVVVLLTLPLGPLVWCILRSREDDPRH